MREWLGRDPYDSIVQKKIKRTPASRRWTCRWKADIIPFDYRRRATAVRSLRPTPAGNRTRNLSSLSLSFSRPLHSQPHQLPRCSALTPPPHTQSSPAPLLPVVPRLQHISKIHTTTQALPSAPLPPRPNSTPFNIRSPRGVPHSTFSSEDISHLANPMGVHNNSNGITPGVANRYYPSPAPSTLSGKQSLHSREHSNSLLTESRPMQLPIRPLATRDPYHIHSTPHVAFHPRAICLIPEMVSRPDLVRSSRICSCAASLQKTSVSADSASSEAMFL